MRRPILCTETPSVEPTNNESPSAASSSTSLSSSPSTSAHSGKVERSWGLGGRVLRVLSGWTSPSPCPPPPAPTSLDLFPPVSLEVLCRDPETGGLRVPPLVTYICGFLDDHGLETEGLFRLNPTASAVQRLEEDLLGLGKKEAEMRDAGLKEAGTRMVFPRDIIPAATLLKRFLRSLPEPLVPHEFSQHFIFALQGSEGEMQSRFLELVAGLPEENRRTLGYLVHFLARVALSQHRNKMNTKALGVVFAPCIFRYAPGEEMELEMSRCHQLTFWGHVSEVTTRLISLVHVIFPHADYGIVRSEAPSMMARDREKKSDEPDCSPTIQHDCEDCERKKEEDEKDSDLSMELDERRERERTSQTYVYVPPRSHRRRLPSYSGPRLPPASSQTEPVQSNDLKAEREEEEVERAKEEEKRAKEEKKRAEEGKEDEKGAERRASLLETLSFPGPEESPIVSHRTRLQEEDAVISSPRSSMVYQRQATAETSEEGDASGEIEGDILLPPSPPHCQVMVDGWPSYHKEPQTQLDASQRHLAKKIRRLKRHLNEEEEAFKAARGYRPSKADMMSHETMSPLLHQIKEAKMEMKRMKEERDNGRSTSRRPHILQTIINIEKRLEELRGEAGRPESLTAMTPDEVSGEKLDVQRALVYLESLHGKPNTREDKAMVQHIYQRYRLLKRLVARSVTTMGMSNSLSTSARSGGSSTLCEIPEHRVLELPEFSPSPSGRGEDSSPSPPQQDPDGDPGLEVEQLQEKYTVSTLKELVQKQRLLLEHRKELKREIRLFEEQFEVEYGRMPRTDEDRAPLAQTYRLYKSIKAKLRLVDALRHKAASCE